MRLDKFLKVSRLVKRRTVAHDLCAAGGVRVNDKVAKPATEIQPGDVITMGLGPRTRVVQVVTVPEKPVAVQQAESLYTVLGETYNEPTP